MHKINVRGSTDSLDLAKMLLNQIGACSVVLMALGGLFDHLLSRFTRMAWYFSMQCHWCFRPKHASMKGNMDPRVPDSILHPAQLSDSKHELFMPFLFRQRRACRVLQPCLSMMASKILSVRPREINILVTEDNEYCALLPKGCQNPLTL